MVDQSSPFSFNIRQAFLNGISRYVHPASLDVERNEKFHKHQEIENQPPVQV